MASEIVLASAVDHHPDAVDRVQTVRPLTPGRPDELGSDHADAALAEMGRGRRKEPGLEEAVGVEEQDGFALSGRDARVVGAGPGEAVVQTQMVSTLLLC